MGFPLLAVPHEENPLTSPMIVTLRHRCECTTREVLTLSVVFDRALGEDVFLSTMRHLYRDMEHEVELHLKQPDTDRATKRREARP